MDNDLHIKLGSFSFVFYLKKNKRLKELQDLTGIPYQEIKKDIFKLLGDEVDLSKELFSKLRRDMADELGLR